MVQLIVFYISREKYITGLHNSDERISMITMERRTDGSDSKDERDERPMYSDEIDVYEMCDCILSGRMSWGLKTMEKSELWRSDRRRMR